MSETQVTPDTKLSALELFRADPKHYVGNPKSSLTLYRLLDAAAEVALTLGDCTEVTVTLHVDSSITIADDGPGITAAAPSQRPSSDFERAFTGLHEGPLSHPHHPCYTCLTFASDLLYAETRYLGKVFSQGFSRGVPTQVLAQIGTTARHGTSVTFRLDSTVFTHTVPNKKRVLRHIERWGQHFQRVRFTLIDMRELPLEEATSLPAVVAAPPLVEVPALPPAKEGSVHGKLERVMQKMLEGHAVRYEDGRISVLDVFTAVGYKDARSAWRHLCKAHPHFKGFVVFRTTNLQSGGRPSPYMSQESFYEVAQALPDSKSRPLKQWLAEVGTQVAQGSPELAKELLAEDARLRPQEPVLPTPVAAPAFATIAAVVDPLMLEHAKARTFDAQTTMLRHQTTSDLLKSFQANTKLSVGNRLYLELCILHTMTPAFPLPEPPKPRTRRPKALPVAVAPVPAPVLPPPSAPRALVAALAPVALSSARLAQASQPWRSRPLLPDWYTPTEMANAWGMKPHRQIATAITATLMRKHPVHTYHYQEKGLDENGQARVYDCWQYSFEAMRRIAAYLHQQPLPLRP